jgi:hypothetical protein
MVNAGLTPVDQHPHRSGAGHPRALRVGVVSAAAHKTLAANAIFRCPE